jgi:hypothetical protein
MSTSADIRNEIRALVARRIRGRAEGSAGQGLSRAGAEARAVVSKMPGNTEGRRAEENPRRSEERSAPSGSKRKRVITDDEDDEEYDPRTEQSEVDDDDESCWNCQQRGIACRRTR